MLARDVDVLRFLDQVDVVQLLLAAAEAPLEGADELVQPILAPDLERQVRQHELVAAQSTPRFLGQPDQPDRHREPRLICLTELRLRRIALPPALVGHVTPASPALHNSRRFERRLRRRNPAVSQGMIRMSSGLSSMSGTSPRITRL